MKWWQVVLEILKYVIPSLVVFATAYYLLRQHLRAQYNMRAMELKQRNTDATIHLKMQAYERLALFCERISLPQLLFRIQGHDLPSGAYQSSLIMAVQQEYEHNFSQQIYVSDRLWQIVDLAKNQVAELVETIGDSIPESASGPNRQNLYLQQYELMGVDPTRIALEAIKKEVSLHL